MRKVKKKNILDKIDDSINDKIDEMRIKKGKTKRDKNILEVIDDKINDKIDDAKSKRQDKKKSTKDKRDNTIYDYEKENNKMKKINNEIDNDKIEDDIIHDNDDQFSNDYTIENNEDSDEVDIENIKEEKREDKGIFEDNMSKKKYKKNKDNDKIKKKKIKKVKPKKEKKKKRSFWKKAVTCFLILCIVGVLVVAGFAGYIALTAPEFNESALVTQDQTVVYDASGNVIAKLGAQKRESVTYDQLPQVLIDAIVATEDSRFFQHNGVDLLRFMKATVLQLMGKDDAGGASTLTMQTVKNNITQMGKKEEKTLDKIIRKFQDVYLSVFKVEKEYSKEEILELYVNDNYLGGPSYYGVEEASKYYFNKSVSDLTLPEASLIAGLFQLPGANNPYVNPDGATKRRSLVLQYMVNHGYITEEEKEIAEKITVNSLLAGNNSNNNEYQGYIDTVVAEVEEETGDNPYTVPMKIYTAMNKSMQDGMNKVFASDAKWIWKDEKVQGGVAIVNVQTGELVAVGAGRNRNGERQFNYATMANRQPGSTSKPIFDYGPAIEYLNYSSYTLVNDEKWSYTNGPNVNNWDGKYEGLQSIRYHLQFSRNVPALKTFQQVGAKNSQKFASSLGLNVSLNSNSDNYEVFKSGLDNTINEAYSIGGAAEGFTPLDMASAYAAFANGGYYIEPHTVNKIIYRETGEEKEFKYTKERVMKDSTAYIMNNILESAVISGFNGGANVSGSHVAAKTGTSNYDEATMKAKGLPAGAVNDLWTVAYTSQYSIAVWYGYDNVDSKYYNDWGKYKDNLTHEVMNYVPKDTKGWSMPSSVVAVSVEKETWPAKLPSEYTPKDMRVTEYFVRGTQPTEVSERYQKLSPLTNVTKVKNDSNNVTISWEYTTPTVLTDEYLKNYFSNSLYGNQKETYLNARIKYNNETLGGLGFGIYKKLEDGTLLALDDGFTTDTKYTYTGYGDTTLVIKAEYKNFKSNASDGFEVSLSLDDLDNTKLDITLGGNTTSYNKGEYYEEGIDKITYGNLNVTKSSNVKYQINDGTTIKEFDTATELEEYINNLDAGTYTITYKVTYLSIDTTKTKKITIK